MATRCIHNTRISQQQSAHTHSCSPPMQPRTFPTMPTPIHCGYISAANPCPPNPTTLGTPRQPQVSLPPSANAPLVQPPLPGYRLHAPPPLHNTEKTLLPLPSDRPSAPNDLPTYPPHFYSCSHRAHRVTGQDVDAMWCSISSDGWASPRRSCSVRCSSPVAVSGGCRRCRSAPTASGRLVAGAIVTINRCAGSGERSEDDDERRTDEGATSASAIESSVDDELPS